MEKKKHLLIFKSNQSHHVDLHLGFLLNFYFSIAFVLVKGSVYNFVMFLISFPLPVLEMYPFIESISFIQILKYFSS